MKRSSQIFKCEHCGIPMRSRQTWLKGSIRKRLYICPECGNSFTTTETRDHVPEKKCPKMDSP